MKIKPTQYEGFLYYQKGNEENLGTRKFVIPLKHYNSILYFAEEGWKSLKKSNAKIQFLKLELAEFTPTTRKVGEIEWQP